MVIQGWVCDPGLQNVGRFSRQSSILGCSPQRIDYPGSKLLHTEACQQKLIRTAAPLLWKYSRGTQTKSNIYNSVQTIFWTSGKIQVLAIAIRSNDFFNLQNDFRSQRWGCADRDSGFLWNSMNFMVYFDGVRFLVSPKRHRKWRDLDEYFSKTYTFFGHRHLWKKLQSVEEGNKSRKSGKNCLLELISNQDNGFNA